MLLSLALEAEERVEQAFEKLTEVTLELHQCSTIDALLQTGVQQVQELFGCDRAVVGRVSSPNQGQVVAETAAGGWPSLLKQPIPLPRLDPSWSGAATPSPVVAIHHLADSDLDAATLSTLRNWQVKAYLASPIWVSSPLSNPAPETPQLWGWLMLHQCRSAYAWQRLHGRVLQHIAIQLGGTLERLQLREQIEGVQTHTAAVIEKTEAKYQQATRACSIGVWDWNLQTDAIYTDFDITDRKQAELDLRASEAFCRQVMELVPIPLYIYDCECARFVYWNPACEATVGYTLDEVQAMGTEFFSVFYHPDDLDRVMAHDQKVWADREGRVYELEYSCFCKDGTPLMAYSREVVLSRKANGMPKEILGFGIDLTERKAMEAALRESHALYESLTEAMPQCLYRKDLEQRFTYANPAMLSWLQLTEADLMGKTVYDVFPPEVANRYDAEDRQVLATGEILDIVDGPQPIGPNHSTYVQVLKSLVQDGAGKVIGTQGIFWDVTDRQHLKQELQESRDQLAMILNSLHAAVSKFRLFDGSFDVVYEYFSPGTEVVFGYSIDALMADARLWRSRIDPEDWEQRVRPSIQALIAGQPHKTIEYRFRHPDGSIHWIQETASAHRDDRRNGWSFTTVATDISDRKQAEFNLEQARILLQQVLDHLPVGVLAKTADTLQFTVWNPACTQLMGYTRDQVLGHTDYDLFPQAQAERFSKDDQDAIASYRLWERPEEVITNKSGQSRIIHNRKVAVYDGMGQAQLVIGIVEDITTRVAAEKALRQREEEFRTLSENSPDGIFRVNAELKLQYVNPAVARRMEMSQAALLNRHLEELGLPTALLAQWQTAITEVLGSGQAQQLETQEALPAGVYAFQSSLVPEHNAQGQIISVLVVSRDITSLKQAQKALVRRVNQEHSLRMITQHMRESLDLGAILSTAVTEVQQVLGADRSLVFQLLSEREGIVIEEAVRPEYPSILGRQWEENCFPQLFERFYRRGQGRIVAAIPDDDQQACLIILMQSISVQSEMVAPITQRLEDGTVSVWGLLMAQACATERQWQPDELDLLQQVANQLAIALQQSELHQQLLAANQELAHLSSTDGLTQVANRRQFDDTLAAEWRRAQRDQRKLTLILCDIDHFKQYNDTYGHPAGDDCLVAVAQTLQLCVNRTTDCVARYGGEEFALILPHTNGHGAIVIVQHIQAAIAALNLKHATHPTCDRLTLSFGITVAQPQRLPDLAELVKRADLALYQAKQAGRNGYAVIPDPQG